MSKSKAKLYIVTSSYVGMPLSLSKIYDDEPEILLGGDTATVFHSARAAKDAIYRTKQYARRKDLPWKDAEYMVGELEWTHVPTDEFIELTME